MSFGDLERGQGGMSSFGRGGDEEYIRLSNRVTGAIQQISGNVTALQKNVSQLGTNKDTEDLRERLHQLNEKTRDLVQSTTKDIQLLGKVDGGSAAENNQRKLQQTKLSKDFQEVLKRYSEIQKISAQRQREFVSQARQRTESMRSQVAHPDAGMDDRVPLIEDQRRQQVQALENEIEFNEAMIMEREEGIKEIETSIAQVNEIFKDLSMMVREQGETLDTIEANISGVVSHTDGANVELKGANKYQKKSRNKMLCILAIGIIVLVGLILAVVLGLNSGK